MHYEWGSPGVAGEIPSAAVRVCLLTGLGQPPGSFTAHHLGFSLSLGSWLEHGYPLFTHLWTLGSRQCEIERTWPLALTSGYATPPGL